MSGFSQLVPVGMSEVELGEIGLRDEIGLYHVFFGEVGWRHLEEIEDGDYDDWLLPDLLARYSFSGWSQERFSYPFIYLLNEEIVKKVGLAFDIDTMKYQLNGESVSVHFINGTDQFFYLRKDVMDAILREYNAKILHHMYERRRVDEKLPDKVPAIKVRFVQNEKDVYYGA